MKDEFRAAHAMGERVEGVALVAHDGFSARYDLDRIRGVFSRPEHKLAGQSYVGRILVLDTAKGGVASAWMLYEMKSRGIVPLALVFNSVNPIIAQGAHSRALRCSLASTATSPRYLRAEIASRSIRRTNCYAGVSQVHRGFAATDRRMGRAGSP